MRTSGYEYHDYRNRFVEIVTKIIRSKYCLPTEHIYFVKEFVDFMDGANSAGKFKKENQAALRNMDFSKFNIRHGYKNSFVGFISEQVSMAYDFYRCQYIRDVHDSKEDNVKRGIDFYTRDDQGDEISVQVKTAQFKGTTLFLERDWVGGVAQLLYLVDLDDRKLVIFKMGDFEKLIKTKVFKISDQQLRLFSLKIVDLSDMY